MTRCLTVDRTWRCIRVLRGKYSLRLSPVSSFHVFIFSKIKIHFEYRYYVLTTYRAGIEVFQSETLRAISDAVLD